MVFVEGDNYRALRRPGDDPAQFRSVVRLPRRQAVALDAAITDGLVAWYRFEDSATTAIDATNALGVGADQTAFDGSVNGASFQSSGGVRDVVSGPNSGAYDFDGVDDNIDVPLLPDNSNATAMCWFQSDDATTEQRLIAFDNQKPNFLLRINSGASDEIQALSNDSNGNQTVSTTNFDVTKPHHIAASFEANNELSLFVDGNQIGTVPVANPSTIFGNDNHIGSNRGGGGNFTDGIIDDARLYNRVLSASEINQIYQNTDPDQ
jgi:hypothetical protein